MWVAAIGGGFPSDHNYGFINLNQAFALGVTTGSDGKYRVAVAVLPGGSAYTWFYPAAGFTAEADAKAALNYLAQEQGVALGVTV